MQCIDKCANTRYAPDTQGILTSPSQETLTPSSTIASNKSGTDNTVKLASDSSFSKTASRQGWSSNTPTRPTLGM
ncbi:hypothetical protein CPB83DRAFT_859455 [Crepidotus variabilis]|uniref:Uncharacterized protein n=1 Tax=Crepidotus variabilis TaxID=179855 RepID=A0A9P6JMA2_9AGAR|nr:hypothetical protein CPB83DRAFT_859455 [Crepidotus variabilis]